MSSIPMKHPAQPLTVASLDRATHLIITALRIVYDEFLPIARWDDNDYPYAKSIADDYESGDISPDVLVWDPRDPIKSWNKPNVFAADAVFAHMQHKRPRGLGAWRNKPELMFRNNVAGNMGEPLEYRNGDDWQRDSSYWENADEVEMIGRVSSR